MARPRLPDTFTGRKFGRLTVLAFVRMTPDSKRLYECRCECGKTVIVARRHLINGNTVSCGCYRRERIARANFTHGHGTHAKPAPEFNVWIRMRARCRNPKRSDYPRYGGRGITVAPEWDDFLAFRRDMGPRPSPHHTIERMDNNRGYSRENCRWATMKAQANNRRSNHLITWNGRTQTLTQWNDELGFPPCVLQDRLVRHGWPLERAMTRPIGRRSKVETSS